MKTICIALHAGRPDSRNAITGFLEAKDWPFWHWQDDLWFTRAPDQVTARSLAIDLDELLPKGSRTMLVFEINGRMPYWGRSPKAGWNWLSEHVGYPGGWKKPDS